MQETFGVKYIGSKKELIPYITKTIEHLKDVHVVNDVFTGTTRVAQALKQLGKCVNTSDLSWASEAYAYTFVHNEDNSHLQPLIDHLNRIKPKKGWLTKTYCDVLSVDGTENIVRVWQPKNGMKADAIRDCIETLDLTHWEKMTLITSLIFALDAVDNTVGVQQAYLKDWCQRSYNDLRLVLPPASPTVHAVGMHQTGDVLKITLPECDLAYIDSPYSAHSYASYYHIWDSITRWDKPPVDLKTNRRVDRVANNKAYTANFESAWNRKREVSDAFTKLFGKLRTKYLLVSYSSDSLLPINELIDICNFFGKTTVQAIDYKRNVMCKIGNMSENKEIIEKNTEYLILVQTVS